MGKRTEADQQFIMRFSLALRSKYAAAKRRKQSDEEFAASIGVERVSLWRYLDGESMPEHRTIVLAYRNHRILVPYDHTDSAAILRKPKNSPDPPTSEIGGDQENSSQLPFSVRAQAVDLKIRPVSSNEVDIGVVLRKA